MPDLIPDLATQLSILKHTLALMAALFASAVILYCLTAIDEEMQRRDEEQRWRNPDDNHKEK